MFIYKNRLLINMEKRKKKKMSYDEQVALDIAFLEKYGDLLEEMDK
jgi:xylose isomerase